ncbi:CPBP family glutamic-type intramembrane protease [Massilia eburnea]|uniref:CPBP family glutamic-type intramembrane protease n=1 Tax=Massilia eburnea TaxID=1776165 RepID=UPI003D6A796D
MFATTAVCGPALLSPDLAAVLRLLLLAPLLEEWVVRAGLHAWLLGHAPAARWQCLPVPRAFSALHLGSGAPAAALVFGPGLALGPGPTSAGATGACVPCCTVHAMPGPCRCVPEQLTNHGSSNENISDFGLCWHSAWRRLRISRRLPMP